MSNDSTTTINGPWRLLILDRSPDDPKWIVATVVELADVRPADPDSAPDEVTARWVADRLRAPIALTHLRHAEVWRVDENGPR